MTPIGSPELVLLLVALGGMTAAATWAVIELKKARRWTWNERHVQILNAVKTSQVGLGLLNACAKVFKEKVGGANIQHKWYRHASRQKASEAVRGRAGVP
jgi:hypothetical protein